MKYLFLVLFVIPLGLGAQSNIPRPPAPSDPGMAKTYDFPEIEAEYPGSMAGFYKDVTAKLIYPNSACAEGNVFVEFIIDKKGELVQAKILGGMDDAYHRSALNALKDLKKWTPAEQDGNIVCQRFKLPIKFKIE